MLVGDDSASDDRPSGGIPADETPSAGDSPARDRILDAAEALFVSKGYSAVTLRDIGEAVGITHASLYHHFAGGKSQLFIEVTERNIRRHGAGLAAAIEAGGDSLRQQLYGAADWLLSQPPMDLVRMLQSDMPSLDPAEARRLMELVSAAILKRLSAIFEAARRAGRITGPDSGILGGAVLGLIESFHSIPPFVVTRPFAEMARELLDVLLAGLGYEERRA